LRVDWYSLHNFIVAPIPVSHRDHLTKSTNSQSEGIENQKPSQSPPWNPTPPNSHNKDDDIVDDDDDYVDISDEDTEMRDADTNQSRRPGGSTKDDLDLHRLSANSADHDLDDSSDEEHESMANHPLLSMLTGRMGQRRRGSTHKWDSLHPVTGVLSVGNVDDCTRLEDQVFPEEERCSKEKV
jgi:hypothetical protein